MFPVECRRKEPAFGRFGARRRAVLRSGNERFVEDCRIFNELVGRHGTYWERVFDEYGALRKENTDAIAQMAEENFYEMRDAVADPVFVRKRELETKLEHEFPDYFSKYSMVTFREDLPYSIAKQKGNAQDKLLMEICANAEDANEIDLNDVMRKVESIKIYGH
jgi:kynurenine 3-monooxygenase